MQDTDLSDFLTTAEVARYLRLKQRTVYELVRARRIPCSRVTGKLLFPRRLIDLWVTSGLDYAGRELGVAPPVIAGSPDPLLEWAVRASGSGLALLAGGGEEGLARLAARQAVAAAFPVLDLENGGDNLSTLHAMQDLADVVLIEWTRREQGFAVAPGNPRGIAGPGDLARPGLRLARREQDDPAQLLLDHLLERAKLRGDSLAVTAAPAVDDRAVVQAVLAGEADLGITLRAVAQQARLGFVPLAWERFDLALRRRDYFEPPLQRLLGFAQGEAFARQAAALGGYAVVETGSVRYNA